MASKYVDFETYRGRGYKMLLYADNRDHMRVLHRLQRHKDYSRYYCGIWHIQYKDDDSAAEIVTGAGKKHAHIIVDLDNPVYWRSFVRNLGADPRFCMPICADIDNKGLFVVKAGSNVRRGLVYLTHVAYPEKEQYSVNQIFGAEEMREKASSAVDKYLSRNLSMSDCAFYICEWIDEQKDYISAIQYARWLTSTPYFKASQSAVVRAVLDEHNREVMRQRQKQKDLQSISLRKGWDVSGSVARSLCLDEFPGFDDLLTCDEGVIF